MTEETKMKIKNKMLGNTNGFKKGQSYWLGKKRPEILNWLTPFKKGQHASPGTEFKSGNVPANYKGDMVSYRNLHRWVDRNLGKPGLCEICGKSGLTGQEIHWASKSQEYKRELGDWSRLCVKCHKEYDKNGKSAKEFFRVKENGTYSERMVMSVG